MTHAVAIIESTGEIGGAQLSLLPVAAALARERRVVAYLPASGPLGAALEELGVHLAEGFELPSVLREMSGNYDDPVSAPRAIAAAAHHQWRLGHALRRLRPAVAYLNGFRAQVGATLPARAAGARVVWHIRDFNRPGALGAGWAALAVGASHIVANSRATAHQPGLRHVARRVSTVYNGVDLTRFRPAPQLPAPPVIGMAAHLSPWKGHERFLRLVARLRRDVPDLRARIAGGEIYSTAGHAGYAQRLRDMIAELRLGDVCAFERIAPQDMPSWLQSLSILVHCPERPEPFGRVLAEALATGLPIVASNEGGVPEVVGDAGVLAVPRDDEELVAHTRRVLADAELRARLAQQGRRRAEAMFDERIYTQSVAAHLR
jgi:glycosyltransferase involved in cell wall biosynthesis